MDDYDVDGYVTDCLTSIQWVQTDESERKHRQLQLTIDACHYGFGLGYIVRAPENDPVEWPTSDEPHRGNG